MKKKTVLILGAILGTLIIIIMVAFFSMGKMIKTTYQELDDVPVVDMERVADGEYTGEAETPLVKVTVQVKVQNHEITDISLVRHVNGKGEIAESMIPVMLRENTSEVDEVSQATLSSKTIRAAVRRALQEGVSK